MGGMGLVEWVLGCREPAALTHNVTPERERAGTECMYYLPLPLGGALLMHVVRCVCPLLFHLYMSVLLFVSSYIVFWNNAVHFFTSLLFSSSSYVSLCLQK